MKISGKTRSLFICAVVMAVVLIFAVSGCGAFEDAQAVASGNYDESMKSAPIRDAAAEEPAMETAEEEMSVEESPAEGGIAQDSDTGYSDTPGVIDRKIIKTAYMEIEVAKGQFEEVLFDLASLAERNGGYVSNTQSYSDEEGNLTSGSISIRIPHDSYNPVIEKIKSMGDIRSISVSGQDVTQEYVDLESRLRNMEAQEKVLLDIMAQSKKPSDTLEVARELSNVQEEIEIIKGRMKYLDNMVSYSTIDVYLFEPEPIATTTGWGFLDALKRGLRGAVTVFNGIIMFIIAMSPIIVILAIVGVIVWLIVRARRRRRARNNT
ncbi:MAG: DUF4349 domain-containing protein [Actinobacteria bacterium]|nr:DUF4349 domain-containing protein [Actinomycetota bacterium]